MYLISVLTWVNIITSCLYVPTKCGVCWIGEERKAALYIAVLYNCMLFTTGLSQLPALSQFGFDYTHLIHASSYIFLKEYLTLRMPWWPMLKLPPLQKNYYMEHKAWKWILKLFHSQTLEHGTSWELSRSKGLFGHERVKRSTATIGLKECTATKGLKQLRLWPWKGSHGMRVMKGHSTIMDITMELKCLFHTHTTRTCYADVIASIAHI